MMQVKMFLLSVMVFVLLSTAGVGAAEPISVFVTIAPQKYFVQQIGKNLVDVQVLVEPGANPHTYEPKPRQMVALTKARLYFAIGIEFEAAKLKKITAMNPSLQVVHTDHGIRKIPITAEIHRDADGHTGGEYHNHPGLDPHIWLSPPLVMIQARSILTALQSADPGHYSTYESNYRAFMVSLIDLDAQIRKIFTHCKMSSFMVFHPAWGTFAHTYGLKQVPIEIEGKAPKPAQLKDLIEYAQTHQINVVFVQPQFSIKSANEIAKAIDGKVIAVDPMAQDWANNLHRVAEEFKHAFN